MPVSRQEAISIYTDIFVGPVVSFEDIFVCFRRSIRDDHDGSVTLRSFVTLVYLATDKHSLSKWSPSFCHAEG